MNTKKNTFTKLRVTELQSYRLKEIMKNKKQVNWHIDTLARFILPLALFLFFLSPLSTFAQFNPFKGSGGSGTQNNPY